MAANFVQIKKNIINVLTQNAIDRFRISSYQPQSEQAEDNLLNNRLVSVYVREIAIPRNASSETDFTFDVTFQIDFTVSAAADGDLSALDNPGATAEEIAAALATLKAAESIADDSIDELFFIVFSILMDARNRDLDTDDVGNRFIDDFNKHDPIRQGSLVMTSGTSRFNIRCSEETPGDDGVPGNIICVEIDPGDESKTGIEESIKD